MSQPLFLEPREKTVGTILQIIAAIFGVGVLWWALPFLTALVWSTAFLLGGLAIAGILLFLITDKKTRSVARQIYYLGIRTVLRKVWGWNPITTLRVYIEALRERLELFDEHRTQFEGVTKNLGNTIDKVEREKAEFTEKADAAHRTGDKQAFADYHRQLERRKKVLERLGALYAKLTRISEMLTKMRTRSESLIRDTEDEVNMKILEFNAASAASGAIENALDLIEGDPELKAMFQSSAESLEAQLAPRLGLIQLMLDDSQGIIKSIDFDKAVEDNRALVAFENWESRLDELTLPGHDPVPLASSTSASTADPASDRIRRALASQAQKGKTL